MVDHIFRQYDIRGKVGTEFAIDEMYGLVHAIVWYFKQQNPHIKTIAVGADGRIHSEALMHEVFRAIQDSGLNVVFIGRCPSPVLYFALFNLPVDAGLMITASHNGPEYNGIKICLGKESVWGNQIQEIRSLARQHKQHKGLVCGTYSEIPLIDSYIAWLKEHFSHLVGMKLSAVVDCGNGAAGYVLPALIKAMEWPHVSLLFPEVDGTYPNHEADPTVEGNMQAVKKVLQTTDIQVGLGLDGDCDRMTPMTKEGHLVAGDKLLALFAQDILKEHPRAAIVFDIKCSEGLIKVITEQGGVPVMSPSGHSIIKDQMKKHQALLAGELSCHFFFHDRYFGYDDGIYALLRLFEIMQKEKKSLHELLKIFPQKWSTPEFRIECAEESKETIVRAVQDGFMRRANVQVITLDGIRVVMPYGWGILRASNTQSVLCMRFEADSEEEVQKVRDDFVTLLAPLLNAEQLKPLLDI